MSRDEEVFYVSNRPELQVIYYDGKSVRHIEELVGSVSISGDVARAYRECSFDFTNTADGRKRIFDVENGKEVRVIVGKVEVFRGLIFSHERRADGFESLSAYDTNVYLTKNNVSVKYVDKTASQIIRDLSVKYGVNVGNIADTVVKIPRFIMRGKSIYDVFITALTMTQQVSGKRYMLVNRASKLELILVRTASVWLRYESGKNLIDATWTESIEDVKTQIEYSGGDENNPVTFVAKKDTAKYGVMQHYEHNSDAVQSSLPGLAQALLEELSKPDVEMSVTVLGMPDVSAGKPIIVQDGLSGLTGSYFVIADSHMYEPNGVHTMDLTLSKTLDLPVLEYEVPDEGDGGLSGDGSGKSLAESATYTKGWVGTAYDPMLGGINTSGNPRTTATSTLWAYNRTIAVDPKVIPYGSVVAIKVPSMSQYDGIYLAEDTGGAIKGKRVDVLIQGKKATSVFGRRDIEVAILHKGSGAPSARANVKQWVGLKSKYTTPIKEASSSTSAGGKESAIVATANSYKGKLRYVFGGKNIESGGGDCSGFTYHVYKKHGIDIGHGTSTQIGKGRAIDKSDAQAGDIVFFQGTYRAGVSHVGIVTRPGYCVSLASSGCQEHSYTTGYWGGHYMQIRRLK